MSQRSVLDFFASTAKKKAKLEADVSETTNDPKATTNIEVRKSPLLAQSSNLPSTLSLAKVERENEISDEKENVQDSGAEVKQAHSHEKVYKQKYRIAWENEFKGWLQGVSSDPYKAFCKLCHVNFRAHRNAIIKHSKSPEHIRCLKSEGIVVPLKSFTKINPITAQKKAELQLTVYVAEHSSIQSVDHLSEFLTKNHSESPTLANLRLHRTKCSKLISEVISPSLHREIVNDIIQSGSFYSLVVDESTDVSCQKCLCLMVRYHSIRHQTVVTTFYCLIKIEQADANSQVEAITQQLQTDGLPLQKLLGLGVDGANVNVGAYHSVSSILKTSVPHLVTFRCVCHSLHLAASKAMDVLPRCLDFIVRESCSWFTCSAKRQLDYQALYSALCDGENALKLGKYAETRWLSRQEVVKKVLDQWDALTLHFQLARSKERCYTADQLFAMFSDPVNKAYLTFLSCELDGICKLNRSFQAENADVTKLLNDLTDYYLSLLQKIVHPNAFRSVSKVNLLDFDFSTSLIPPTALHLGYSPHLILDGVGTNKQIQDQIKEVCFTFLKELANQVKKRLPDNLTILRSLEILSPRFATSQSRPSISSLASQFPSIGSNIDLIEKEWNILPTKMWNATKDTVQFWIEVYNNENAEGGKKFFNVSYFALSLLCLPFSNATVERAFSQMNAVKSKLRNRLSVKMVNAVLQTRYGMRWRKEDCRTFLVSNEMLKSFNSSIYESKKDGSEKEEEKASVEEVVEALNALDHS